MDDQAEATKLVGRTLRGKYRIDRVLGTGGMGVVVLARHLKLDQDVAIKLLRANVASRPGIITRFAREARAAARLKSDHVVRILDVDEDDDGSPFFVMERLHGNDLEQIIEREGRIGTARAVGIVLQACEAMAEAHARGMVHRDLKPANLFVVRTRDGRESVKILDFGISKTEEGSLDDAALTSPTAIIGSPLYMSPEQIRSSKSVDHRADVWALGVVLYELLTRALPFQATNVTGLAAAIAADAPRPIRELLPDVPDGIVGAIDRCLAKDASARFPDVIALAEAIAPFAGEMGDDALRRVRNAVIEVEASDPALRTTQPETSRDAVQGSGRHTETISDDDHAMKLAKSTAGTSAHSVKPAPMTEDAPAAPSTRRRPLRTIGAFALIAGIGVAGVVVMREPSSPSTTMPVAREAAPRESIAPPMTATSATDSEVPAPPPATDASVAQQPPPPRPTPSNRPRSGPPAAVGSTSAPVAPAVSSSRSPLDIDLK